MLLNQFLLLAAILFSIGVYGVIARKNAVLVLMSIELILNSVNINLMAFSHYMMDTAGLAFCIFVITVAAAEVTVGLSILVMMKRNVDSVDVNQLNRLKG